MSGLEARLRRIESKVDINRQRVYIFCVGDQPRCTHGSEEELERELEKAKYKNAIVIIDIPRWQDESWIYEK